MSLSGMYFTCVQIPLGLVDGGWCLVDYSVTIVAVDIVVAWAHNIRHQIRLQDATALKKQPDQGSGSSTFAAELSIICTTHQHSRTTGDT